MFYFISVFIIWFLVRLYCRIVYADRLSQPYHLNRVYLDPIDFKCTEKRSFASIRPVDELSIDEDEIRRVLIESKKLSQLHINK